METDFIDILVSSLGFFRFHTASWCNAFTTNKLMFSVFAKHQIKYSECITLCCLRNAAYCIEFVFNQNECTCHTPTRRISFDCESTQEIGQHVSELLNRLVHLRSAFHVIEYEKDESTKKNQATLGCEFKLPTIR